MEEEDEDVRLDEQDHVQEAYDEIEAHRQRQLAL